jgi:hypothetical protein
MIVRINHFDPATAVGEAGWASAGMLGPLPLSPGLNSFELLILETDELGRPLPVSFRQSQYRRIIPHALAALAEPGEQAVIRLDGPLADGELFGAFRWLTDPDGRGRFALSGARKLDDDAMDSIGSLRVCPSPARLGGLIADPDLGLERSVRLRAFTLPEVFVPTLLEIDATEDSRWDLILRSVSVMVGTTYDLQSLHIYSRRLQAGEIRTRIMQRLLAAMEVPASV